MVDSQFSIKTYEPVAQLLMNKIILVTGAGDGIGKTVAKIYARYGATVILLGRTTSKLASVGDAIKNKGGAATLIYPMDLEKATVTDYKDLAKVINNKFGKLDGLLHNAGILGERTSIEHQDLEIWNTVQQVNVYAPLMLTQACLPLLKKAPSASLIFTSSGVGRKGKANWGAYSVSKFATEGLMQILADELKTHTNVRCNCINPGATSTAMRASAYPDEDPSILFTAAQIMPLYLYLMSDDSRAISGQSMDAQ